MVDFNYWQKMEYLILFVRNDFENFERNKIFMKWIEV